MWYKQFNNDLGVLLGCLGQVVLQPKQQVKEQKSLCTNHLYLKVTDKAFPTEWHCEVLHRPVTQQNPNWGGSIQKPNQLKVFGNCPKGIHTADEETLIQENLQKFTKNSENL